MKSFSLISKSVPTRVRCFGGILLVLALLTVGVNAALADQTPLAGVPTEDAMRAFALQWFAQMQAGKIDRTQYTAAYSAQCVGERFPFSVDGADRVETHNFCVDRPAAQIRCELLRVKI